MIPLLLLAVFLYNKEVWFNKEVIKEVMFHHQRKLYKNKRKLKERH